MKISDGAIWCASGAVAIVLSGCVDLAQVNYGPEETDWQRALRQSYSGYCPPRTPPPAVIGEPGSKNAAGPAAESAAEVKPLPAPPAENPQAVVDGAAAKDASAAEAVPAEPAAV